MLREHGTPLVAPLKPDGSPYLSGTEFEYQEAVADAEEAGRVVLVYRCTREPQVSLRDSKYQEKQRQLALVDEFFGGLQAAGRGHNPFDTVEVFKARLESHLRELVPRFSRRNRTPSKARSPRDQRKSAPLVPDAYRAWLKKETGTLELLGLSGAQGRSLFLSSVYVPIVTLRSEERRERMTRIDAEGDMREQADLLLHALGHRGRVHVQPIPSTVGEIERPLSLARSLHPRVGATGAVPPRTAVSPAVAGAASS